MPVCAVHKMLRNEEPRERGKYECLQNGNTMVNIRRPENDSEPSQVLQYLFTVLPDFKLHWERDNYFIEDSGDYTLHSIFIVLSHYIRDTFGKIKEERRLELFDYIEHCLTSNEADSGFSNAVTTCFLENLAGEGPISDSVNSYLKLRSKEYFEKWNTR